MKFDELKDKWGNPREKAKIQLILFLIFIVFAVIFIRLTPDDTNNDNINEIGNIVNNPVNNFNSIVDNYNYNITIDIETNDGNKIVSYGGIRYKNDMIISKEMNGEISNYYMNDDEYYIYDNGNYLLTSADEVYDIISINYLDVLNIKEYLKQGIKDGNIYLIKTNKINQNITNNEYITIEMSNADDEVKLLIDYTNLLKNDEIITCKVEYTFSNINKVNYDDINFQKYIEKNLKM